MTLDTGKINETYTIEKIDLPLKLEKRLEALGMTEGTSILVLNAKSRGTLIVNVGEPGSPWEEGSQNRLR